MAMAAHPTSTIATITSSLPVEADHVSHTPFQPAMHRTGKRHHHVCPNLAAATTGGVAAASAIFMCTAAAPLALGMMSPNRHNQNGFP